MMISGICGLRPDSPAIDGGDNDWLPKDEWDLDGDGNIEEPLPVDLAGKAGSWAESWIWGPTNIGPCRAI